MKRKVCISDCGFGQRGYCIPKECKQELEELFKNFKYSVRIEDVKDDNVRVNKWLLREDILLRDFWYAVLTKLKEAGYEFSSYVQSKYEWYKSEHIKLEEERRIAREKENEAYEEKVRLCKEQEEQRKKEESETGWLCVKYGCLTTLAFCKKCEYNTRYNLNCSPKKVKLIK